jgi:predicted transcriptional regulator with HTH domain
VDGVVAWRIRDERGLCAWLSEQRDCYLHTASREVGSAPGELAGLREQLATIYAVRELVIKLQIIPCSCSEIAVLLAYEQAAYLDAASIFVARQSG